MSSSKEKDAIKAFMDSYNRRIKESGEREGIDKAKVEKYFQEMKDVNRAFWAERTDKDELAS